jgi:hypothetical protein
MAAAASQSASRFAGIKKKSIKPELDVDGRVKQVNKPFIYYIY